MGKLFKKEIKGIVYKVTSPSNKIYIGITITNLKERQRTHLRDVNKGSKLPFHNAIRKYGIENLVWEVIDNENDFQKLKKLEINYIKEYDTYNKGYNQTLGGEGSFGFKHTKEQKENNSKIRKQFLSNKENRDKISKSVIKTNKENPQLGKKHSKLMKGRFKLDKNRIAVSDGMKKYLSTKENRLKHALDRGAKPFKVKKDGVDVGEWIIQSECAEKLGLLKSHLNKCLKGLRNSHKGYTFEYV